MKNYELTLVFSPQVLEEQIQQLLGETTGFLQENGALLLKQWARQEGKNRIGVLAFTLSPETLQTVQQFIQNQKDVKSFMLTNAPIQHTATPAILKTPSQMPEQQKVSIEDIDKKIEEIFKQNV